ncbi:MAG: CBS domain-containing protein [Planctomycetota bacterium]
MRVRDIMTLNAEMMSPDCNLVEAAEKMKSLEVGALPVCEGDSFVGMVTDRDIIVRAIAEGKNPLRTSVGEIMTPDVFSCYEDDDIHDAAEVMEEKSIHRLLVLNIRNKPVGFVSLADFACKSRDERLAWEILEKISEPACPHR